MEERYRKDKQPGKEVDTGGDEIYSCAAEPEERNFVNIKRAITRVSRTLLLAHRRNILQSLSYLIGTSVYTMASDWNRTLQPSLIIRFVIARSSPMVQGLPRNVWFIHSLRFRIRGSAL